MEQITYYQGEDIAITVQAYTDNTCSETESLSGCTAQALVYSTGGGTTFYGTSFVMIDFEMALSSNSGVIYIELPASLTSQLEPGYIRMEIMLKDSDGITHIAKCSVAQLEESLISKIVNYGS